MADGHQVTETKRGREAETPRQIPLRGWKDIVIRSWQHVSDNNIFLIAGGVTYSVLIALFPALAALVSLYGLAFDPSQIEQQVQTLNGVLPQESLNMLRQELHQLASSSKGGLGFGAIIGLLLALWSASRGMSGLVTALNVAYEEKETRGFFKLNFMAFGLTLIAILGGLLIIALVAVLPAAIQFVGLASFAKWLLLLLEWPLLLGLLLVAMAGLYFIAPNRNQPRWRWLSPGALSGAIVWLIGSIGFSIYVANFSSYDKTYGSLGGTVILLTWLYLSSLILLFGAVINAEAERQTCVDTTERDPRPMGQRSARAADTVSPSTR